jgi:hypothetical protein
VALVTSTALLLGTGPNHAQHELVLLVEAPALEIQARVDCCRLICLPGTLGLIFLNQPNNYPLQILVAEAVKLLPIGPLISTTGFLSGLNDPKNRAEGHKDCW